MPVDTRHPNFPGPSDDTVVWRYSNLPKLLSLLTTQKLFFPTLRVLQKDDPFEGTTTLQNRRFAADLSASNPIAEAMFRVTYPSLNEETLSQFRPMFIRSLNGASFSLADTCCVSCWHERRQESAALWKLYAETQAGVAIKSSIGKICQSIDTELNLILGKVHYCDFDSTFLGTGNSLAAAFTKRDSYEHEHEVRILHWDLKYQFQPGLPGISIDCDPTKLIEEIVVSPYADDWMVATVSEVVRRMGFDFQVKKSKLMDTSL